MTRQNGKQLTWPEKMALYEALVQGGTATKVADEFGVYRRTAYRARQELMEAGLEAMRAKTGPAPAAPEPEPEPAEVHDAAFWRKRHDRIERERNELAALLRKLGKVDGLRIRKPSWMWAGPGERQGRAVLIVHNSDRHLGEVVEAREINGWNSYDVDVCRRRVKRFIDAACELGRRWTASTKVDGVLYTMGGDEISGDIHDELARTNALTSLEQVQAAAQLHAECVHQLVEEFGRIHVECVPGNHGRTTKKPTAKKYAALSYDTMIGGLVAERFRDDERVSFSIADGSDAVISIYGRNILLTHGDKIGTGGGQGFAGPELPMLRGGHKVRAQYASAGTPIDVILGGHFHTSANLRGALWNGSVVGQSEFGLGIRAPLDAPRQWLALYRGRWGLTERLDVRLEEPAKPRIRVMPETA